MSPPPAPAGRPRTPRWSWRREPRDPWRNAPVSELQDQVLPRWFVLLGLLMVPVALGVLVAAFVVAGFDDVAAEARRPPPAGGLSHAVGDLAVAPGDPVVLVGDDCGLVTGIAVGGSAAERQTLERGLEALCAADLPAAAQGQVRAFADAGGEVRFAAFQATGVDSVWVLDPGALPPDAARPDGPLLLINARFAQLQPWRIAPLVVHDLTLGEQGAGQAEAALEARRAELAACEELQRRRGAGDRGAARACADAQAVLGLPDPLAALRDVGYR